MTAIKINTIKITNFKPKELVAEFEIAYMKDSEKLSFKKEYLLKNPEGLLNRVFLDIKSRDKIIVDDPRLDPVEKLNIYSPIIIKDEDKVEEKVYRFIRVLCEKAISLKNTRNAQTHMKLFDEFKTASLSLE
ncbi:MAG: hypothetical protein AABX08_00915 [Nanoarchaeota archaeon]